MYTTTIKTSTGHSMYVRAVARGMIPADCKYIEDFTKFYIVTNWDRDGSVFFYVASGNTSAPEQICVWYPKNKRMWSSYGKTIKAAVEGAISDGWMYA